MVLTDAGGRTTERRRAGAKASDPLDPPKQPCIVAPRPPPLSRTPSVPVRILRTVSARAGSVPRGSRGGAR